MGVASSVSGRSRARTGVASCSTVESKLTSLRSHSGDLVVGLSLMQDVTNAATRTPSERVALYRILIEGVLASSVPSGSTPQTTNLSPRFATPSSPIVAAAPLSLRPAAPANPTKLEFDALSELLLRSRTLSDGGLKCVPFLWLRLCADVNLGETITRAVDVGFVSNVVDFYRFQGASKIPPDAVRTVAGVLATFSASAAFTDAVVAADALQPILSRLRFTVPATPERRWLMQVLSAAAARVPNGPRSLARVDALEALWKCMERAESDDETAAAACFVASRILTSHPELPTTAKLVGPVARLLERAATRPIDTVPRVAPRAAVVAAAAPASAAAGSGPLAAATVSVPSDSAATEAAAGLAAHASELLCVLAAIDAASEAAAAGKIVAEVRRHASLAFGPRLAACPRVDACHAAQLATFYVQTPDNIPRFVKGPALGAMLARVGAAVRDRDVAAEWLRAMRLVAANPMLARDAAQAGVVDSLLLFVEVSPLESAPAVRLMTRLCAASDDVAAALLQQRRFHHMLRMVSSAGAPSAQQAALEALALLRVALTPSVLGRVGDLLRSAVQSLLCNALAGCSLEGTERGTLAGFGDGAPLSPGRMGSMRGRGAPPPWAVSDSSAAATTTTGTTDPRAATIGPDAPSFSAAPPSSSSAGRGRSANGAAGRGVAAAPLRARINFRGTAAHASLPNSPRSGAGRDSDADPDSASATGTGAGGSALLRRQSLDAAGFAAATRVSLGIVATTLDLLTDRAREPGGASAAAILAQAPVARLRLLVCHPNSTVARRVWALVRALCAAHPRATAELESFGCLRVPRRVAARQAAAQAAPGAVKLRELQRHWRQFASARRESAARGVVARLFSDLFLDVSDVADGERAARRALSEAFAAGVDRLSSDADIRARLAAAAVAARADVAAPERAARAALSLAALAARERIARSAAEAAEAASARLASRLHGAALGEIAARAECVRGEAAAFAAVAIARRTEVFAIDKLFERRGALVTAERAVRAALSDACAAATATLAGVASALALRCAEQHGRAAVRADAAAARRALAALAFPTLLAGVVASEASARERAAAAAEAAGRLQRGWWRLLAVDAAEAHSRQTLRRVEARAREAAARDRRSALRGACERHEAAMRARLLRVLAFQWSGFRPLWVRLGLQNEENLARRAVARKARLGVAFLRAALLLSLPAALAVEEQRARCDFLASYAAFVASAALRLRLLKVERSERHHRNALALQWFSLARDALLPFACLRLHLATGALLARAVARRAEAMVAERVARWALAAAEIADAQRRGRRAIGAQLAVAHEVLARHFVSVTHVMRIQEGAAVFLRRAQARQAQQRALQRQLATGGAGGHRSAAPRGNGSGSAQERAAGGSPKAEVRGRVRSPSLSFFNASPASAATSKGTAATPQRWRTPPKSARHRHALNAAAAIQQPSASSRGPRRDGHQSSDFDLAAAVDAGRPARARPASAAAVR